jgi:2-iminobutanoate/2-iminopropanoate deaminase
MKKQAITTDAAPKAVGPYSQAIKAGQWIFLSGQIPIDPETNQVALGSIEEQTSLVLRNAGHVLEAAGSSLERVVKVTLFIANMEEYPKINAVYSTFFPNIPPARSVVQVARLPRDVGIEAEMIALAD